MFERPTGGDRAVLVHFAQAPPEYDTALAEFRELASSAGADVVAVFSTILRRPDPALLVGLGKAQEIALEVSAGEADIVIVNHNLSPAQERNLERELRCRVVDRIGLILDIFAQRASTFEGKLQVELAQLRHLSTRLIRGWTHLERQKGGIGLRGPGETQLETDRRLIGGRIRTLGARLERVRSRRDLSRRARRRAEGAQIALVGYTNAGKSSLFNLITGARAVTEDRLFATLDPTLRRVQLENRGQVICADTVGFIRDLPHELVAAFRATLEETRSANLLLHVIDAAAPDYRDKRDDVNAVLDEIGAGELPQVEVYNKIDLLPGVEARAELCEQGGPVRERIWLSAGAAQGLGLLKAAIAGHALPQRFRQRVVLPASCGRLRARLFELADVVHEGFSDDGGWVMDVDIRRVTLDRLVAKEGLDRKFLARTV